MRNGEIIICGLTEWEKSIIKEHRGECSYCMDLEYNDYCTARDVLLDGRLNDCEDWRLDTR